MKSKKYPWAPIRNLLTVLFSGVCFAFLFALLILYNYSPSGRYLLANTLLSPETIATLSYKETNSAAGKNLIYQYDRIEYAHWDAAKKHWTRVQLSPIEYRQWYQKIADEKSILDVSNEIVNQFYESPPSKLTIFVKPQNENRSLSDLSKSFQVAEFSNGGDYYRIGLREQEGKSDWVYFYHPYIQQEALELFFNEKM